MSEWKSITICLPQYFDIWIGIILFNFYASEHNKKTTKKPTQTKKENPNQTKPMKKKNPTK